MSLNNAGGLIGTAVGLVVLGEGIRLITHAEKNYYRSRGHKIHPMSKLDYHLNHGKKLLNGKKLKSGRKGLIHQKGIGLPGLKLNIKI